MKEFQLKEMEEQLFELLDTRHSIKFYDDNDKQKIDSLQKINNYPLLSTLNILFTCHKCHYCYMRL